MKDNHSHRLLGDVFQCKWSKNEYARYIYGTSIAYSVIIFTAGKKWLKKSDSGMSWLSHGKSDSGNTWLSQDGIDFGISQKADQN